MKVLNPIKPKFPIRVNSIEEYIKKSRWLFDLGYKSYNGDYIHEAVNINAYSYSIDIYYDGPNIGLRVKPNFENI